MIFSIRLADTNFRIHTLHPDTKQFCQGYFIDDSEKGVEISICQADIEKEKVYVIKEAQLEGYQAPLYSDGVLETTAVYRKIADYFSLHEGSVMHGALIEYEGKGYLFTAHSGIGKTTHIMNWLKRFPEAKVINGDKPILRFIDGKLIAYGTPWAGKEAMNINASVPLKAIVCLHRSETNSINKVSLKNVISKIITAVYHSEDGEGMKRALQFIAKMNEAVSFYELGCNMDVSSAEVAYLGMKEE